MEKKSRGRKRLEMKPIVEESRRHVAFSKRKAGLFNKAAELSVLTGSEVVAIVFSKYGKSYTFSTPNGHSLVSAVLSGGQLHAGVGSEECSGTARELRRLEDTARRAADQRRREKACGAFWWDRHVADVDDLPAFLDSLVNLRSMVADRAVAAREETERPYLALLNNIDDNSNGVVLKGSPSNSGVF